MVTFIKQRDEQIARIQFKCKLTQQQVVSRRRALLEASQQEEFPYTLQVGGVPFEIDRNVFSPKWFESSLLFYEIFPFASGQQVLDMGCGCGMFAIQAALYGATVADAVDIVQEAVENTQRNAERLGVGNIVRCWQSDLFSEIHPQSQYDIVFWNPPWVFIDPAYQYKSLLEMSVLDPGYQLLSRFLEDAPSRLKSDGRLLLGFADFGEIQKLERLTHRFFYSMKEIGRRKGKAPDHFSYMIYELRPN